jgi:hypothetical protein
MKETLLESRINQVLLQIKWTNYALRSPYHTPQLEPLRRSTLTSLLQEYAILVKKQVEQLHATRNALIRIGTTFKLHNGRFYINP